MTSGVTTVIPDTRGLTDVPSEQIRILFASIPISLISILICSLALAVVQWSVIDHDIIITWLIGTNLLSVVRWTMYRRFRRSDTGPVVDPDWYRRAVASSIASGLTWGLGGYFLFAEQSPVHQVFLGLVVAGICAGAITTLSAISLAARGFVTLAILPIIIKFNLIDSEISLAMIGVSVLFVVMILISSQRINKTIVESLQIRHQRELAEKTIRHQAHFDDLTDLPNRRLLLTTLRREMAKADRHRRIGAVFFIDLDRFKSINDSLGHAVGDDLLVEVARRIAERLRREDTVGRLGGDEFVVLLPEVGDDQEAAAEHATHIAEEIRKRFKQPFQIQGHDIHLSISIGIALFPMNVPAEDLLKFADVAMYRAKNEGRDSVRLFSDEMQEAVNQHRVIEKGLRLALDNEEFELYYQAQLNAKQQIVGAEALLRWNHPEKGIIAPGEFIDVAEQTGLIVPIGEWVLRTACEHLVKLPHNIMVSVNVSPRQFSDKRFIDHLQETLLETGADPGLLKLEITEGLAMADIEHTIETMNQIKALGLSFSIDDFGTGYSSLSYLKRLPVDELKIDQAFVRDISETSDLAIIADTIIVMAQKMNLEIVAEGIETVTELDYLLERRCDRFQGYYLSRPVSFDEFIEASAPQRMLG